MKKLFMYAVVLLTLCLIACETKEKEIASFEFNETDLVVLKGSELPELKFTPIYKDETKGSQTTLTKEMVSNYDKTMTGMQTVKATHLGFESTFDVFVADKIINTKAELRNAINTQKDGEVIAIKAGTYDLDRSDTREFSGNTNFYFLITANNSIWRGFGDVTVLSTTESANGVLATQNFVTVVGDDVEINNINLKSKKDANKVIEIYGQDCVIRNLTINPIDNDINFAGSIYLHCEEGNTLIEDVVLNYGRITTTDAGEEATLTLKNVTIDYANSSVDDSDREISLWGFRNTANITVTATNCKITVSSEFKASDQYDDFVEQLPENFTVTEK